MATPTVPATSSLTALIQESARTALQHPESESAERMRILGLLLDPSLNAVDRAIARYEGQNRFPTTEREKIAMYIHRAIERRVLGAEDGQEPLDLEGLARLDGAGWVRRFAQACVQHGVTQVRRDRNRSAFVGSQVLFEDSHLAIARSAEEMYLLLEREPLIDRLSSQVEKWDEDSLSAFDRQAARSEALRALRGFPELHVRGLDERRWVSTLAHADGAESVLRASLLAFRDLASGSPTWEQACVDDRLLDLWVDFDADQAEALACAEPQVLLTIVRGALALPPRPNEASRIAVRRAVKSLSRTSGWPTLVMDLERGWVATFFDARAAHNNMDKRTDAEVEADRARDAELWAPAVERVLAFPGAPLGESVSVESDVAAWLHTCLTLATQG